MAKCFTIELSSALEYNRFSAEFFDPEYVFTPNEKYEWVPIGKVLNKCEYGLSLPMNLDNNGYPMVRMNELEDGFVGVPLKCANMPKSLFTRYKLNLNDILFNRTNSFEFVGRTGILKGEFDCTFASYLVRLIANTDIVSPEYLTIYLNSEFGVKQIKRRAMRSINQANVNAEELKKIMIPLISTEIQEEVTRLTNKSYEFRTHSLRQIQDALEMINNELPDACLPLDHLPNPQIITSSNEIARHSRIDAEFYQTKYVSVTSAVKNYPHGYIRLTDCIDVLKPNFQASHNDFNSYNYVALADIDNDLGMITSFNRIMGRKLPSRAKRITSSGDVLASSVVGSLDKTAIVLERQNDFIASTGFFHFRPKSVTSEYLWTLLMAPFTKLLLTQQATGGILSAIPENNLKNILIPDIPSDIQRRITKLVKSAHSFKLDSIELLSKAINLVDKSIKEALYEN